MKTGPEGEKVKGQLQGDLTFRLEKEPDIHTGRRGAEVTSGRKLVETGIHMEEEDGKSTYNSERPQDSRDRREYRKKNAARADVALLEDKLHYLEEATKECNEGQRRRSQLKRVVSLGQHDHRDVRLKECEDTDAVCPMQQSTDHSLGTRPKQKSRERSLEEWDNINQKCQNWEESIQRMEYEINNLTTNYETTVTGTQTIPHRDWLC